MWYSATQIGITEIDMDHSNIDTMLQLFFSDRIPQSYLEQIIRSLIRHFDHEEEVIAGLGREFPDGHKQEHARLVQLLEEKLVAWKDGSLDGKAFAEEVRSLLLLHVVEFDALLGEPAD